MEADIKVFDEVDSTNITLEKMAAFADEGTCIVSFCQRKGQGRSGRSFFSPKGGNLYMSMLLCPKSREVFSMITVMAACAVVDAIKRQFGIDTGIKWVNDILYHGRKVCGIIATGYDIGKEGEHVILGIGVNIFDSPNVPDDISGIYGSLLEKECDLAEDDAKSRALDLANEIITQFSKYYEHAPAACIEVYRAYSIVIGKSVIYLSGDEEYEAMVKGICDDGSIVLETKDGIRSYRDGEIRLKLMLR